MRPAQSHVFVTRLLLLSAFVVAGPACAGAPGTTSRRAPKRQAIKTYAPATQATLLHLIDADSAWFQIPGRGRFKGRFYGINAPECHKRHVRTGKVRSARCASDDEYFGMGAYLIAKQLLVGKQLTLDCPRKRNGRCRTGGFGRILVMIRIGDTDVMEALVARGAAWTFTKYPSSNRKRLCALEERARKRGAGMWAIGRAQVEARMRAKTRKWYRLRDAICQR